MRACRARISDGSVVLSSTKVSATFQEIESRLFVYM